jgi:hypothetical protein
LDGDYFFEIFDTGDTGVFRITKSDMGQLTFIYQSTVSDATYGWFDPVLEVVRELHASN